MEEFTAVGLGLLVLGTGIKEIFSWFKQKSLMNADGRMTALENNQKQFLLILEPLRDKVEELHEWHDKSDQDGVKIWYIRQSLENILRENAQATSILAKNSELQTSLLKEMIEGQKYLMREQATILNEIKLSKRPRDD